MNIRIPMIALAILAAPSASRALTCKDVFPNRPLLPQPQHISFSNQELLQMTAAIVTAMETMQNNPTFQLLQTALAGQQPSQLNTAASHHQATRYQEPAPAPAPVEHRNPVPTAGPDFTPARIGQVEFPAAYRETVHYPENAASFASVIYPMKVGQHTIRTIFPDQPDFLHMKNAIHSTLLELPLRHMKTFNNVYINPLPWRGDNGVGGSAAAAAGRRDLYIFPTSFMYINYFGAKFLETARHELGHLVSNYFFGEQIISREYHEAVRRDGNQVSDYGQTNIREDFAEGFELYLRFNGDGGYRGHFRNRFEFFDQLFTPGGKYVKNAFADARQPATSNAKSTDPRAILRAIDANTALLLFPDDGVGFIIRSGSKN